MGCGGKRPNEAPDPDGMAVSVYRNSDWQCVQFTVPTQRLYELLEEVLPHLALEYNSPEALNGLFCWTAYQEPWQIQAFVLHHGIGHPHASRMHLHEVAGLLEKETAEVRQACYGDVPLRLTEANTLIREAQAGARRCNEFRMIGLEPKIWLPLAQNKLYTIADLVGQGAIKLMQIWGIKEAEVGEIAGRLYEFGWYLTN